MSKKLIQILALIYSLSLLCSCSYPAEKQNDITAPICTDASLNKSVSPLPQSEDMGQEYIDSFVFIGESTTYHLKSRGVLSGGTNTDQVWGPKSGTLMLDPTTASCRIVYPETNEEIDIAEAAASYFFYIRNTVI